MTHEFRTARFMSAAHKATIVRAWVRFVKSGWKSEQFPKALYDHLIQHCSFIAHSNRVGFYSHYFVSGDSTSVFLSQFDSCGPCSSVEYGGHYWLSGDYEDINRAMIAEGQRFIPSLLESAHRRQKAADIASATALLARHGISVESEKVNGVDRSIADGSKRSQQLLPYG